MKNTSSSRARFTRIGVSIAALCLTLSPALAQQALPVSTASSAPEKDEAVQLSPFRVISDDKGYQAANTMSGTRLNTKLEDVFSSITVVTKQQMLDTAVLDINDVFKYEASTEGTANFTLISKDQNAVVSDKTSSDPQRANRIRGLSGGLGSSIGANSGGANTAFGNFPTNSSIPFDLYNIEAVEISRGPNSSLFGVGQAIGTVNVVPSQANLRRLSFSATLRADNWGGSRESVNVNVPLFRDKLAIRVAAVTEDKGFTRDPASEKIHREFATLLAQPFKKTTIRIAAENYNNKNRRPGALTPIETISTWKANGSPTWDPQASRAIYKDGTLSAVIPSSSEGNAPGIAAGGLPIGLTTVNTGKPFMFFDNSGFQFFTVQRTGNPTTGLPSPYTTNSELRYQASGGFTQRYTGQVGALALPLYAPNRIGDKSVYDWSAINVVSANHQEDKAKTISAELEQVLYSSPNHLIAARAGWFRQDYRNERANWLDGNNTITLDINNKLLDGRPNPFYLRPYVEVSSPNPGFQLSLNDIQNADFTYQYTPGVLPKLLKWIGQQRVAVHAEAARENRINWNEANYFTDLSKVSWLSQTAANYTSRSEIANRFYLGAASNDPRAQYGAYPLNKSEGTYAFNYFDNNRGVWVNDPMKVEQIEQSGNHSRTRTELRSMSYSEQGFFFGDRLVTTVGYRTDRQRARTSAGTAIDPTTGRVNYANNAFFRIPWFLGSGETKTYGAVAKVTKWLSLSGGYSDSTVPRELRYDLRTLIPQVNPSGQTREYGASFTLLEGKLYFKVNRYTTKALNDRGSGVLTLGSRTLDNLTGRNQPNERPNQSTLRYFGEETVAARFRAQGVTPTPQQSFDAVAKFLNWTPTFLSALTLDNANRINAADSVDSTSRGYELELTYNPTRNWRIKVTGSKARAQDDRIGTNTYDFWTDNVPFWSTLRYDSVAGNGDGKGPLWWSTQINTVFNTYLPNASLGQNNDGTIWANRLYTTEFMATYKNLAANVGKRRTQDREYRFAVVSNYEITRGLLKNLSVGGAIRWESEAAIGYLAGKPETTGVFTGAVLELDVNKPVFDKSHAYFDFSASYRVKLFRDKFATKIQLNVLDAFEGGRLQAIAVNPDGKAYAYRIVDPRRFVLSMTFDL